MIERPTNSSLPPELFEMLEFSPMEDIALARLRATIPSSIQVNSLVQDSQSFPLILVRRQPDFGSWSGDDRGYIDNGQLVVHVYCQGIEADSDCAFLSEAVRVALRASVNVPVEGIGHISAVRMLNAPRRVPDWATSQGPVQYADLPTGVQRYETVYDLTIRNLRP